MGKAQLTEILEKVKAPLDNFAADLVAKFEKFAPSYKGAAPKTFVDLVLVSLYLLVVLYIVLKIVSFAFFTGLSIFCCVCCCGCCRRGSKGAKSNGKHAAKREAAKAGGKAAD